jgi:glycosyltransferase involved in cell wall biosynthesis
VADLADPAALAGGERTKLTREIARADAVYALIPSPIGILGLALALAVRKRVLVRQLNSWSGGCSAPSSSALPVEETWCLPPAAIVSRLPGAVLRSAGFSAAPCTREVAAHGTPRRLDAERHPRLIIAGREVEIEGTLVVLRALSILATDFPDIALDVVGKGAALSKSRRLSDEMSLSNRVMFHGPVGHARAFELLREADLFCLPAVETEAFRQSVHEALACGLPLVAARNSVLPMDTGCCMFVDENSPETMAKAIRACLTDPEMSRRMWTDAVRAAKAYTLERWCDTIRSALETAWGPLQSGAAGVAAVGEGAGVERARS